MRTMLKESTWLVWAFTAVMAFNACQSKGGSAGAGQETSGESDSIKIKKSNFNKDPKQPVEWEVTMKKGPDGTYYRHGEALRYTPSGKLAEKVQYVNNKKEGQRLFYYLEGTVWKEQQYVGGYLHGDCKRYSRTGKVEAEYTYAVGLPGIGLKEYTPSGNLKPDPVLTVSQTDEIKATGFHRLTASLSGEGLDRVKKVEFFEGQLIDGRFVDVKKLTPFRSLSHTQGEMLLPVSKGTFIDTDLNIVAVVSTKSGLKLVLSKKIKVSVRGG